jgi:transcriptional regulator with XRE-family HTH domain
MSRDPLAARLTAARVNADLSREIVATTIDRSWSTLAGYERGKTVPPVPVLIQLADLYGVPAGQLLDGPAAYAGATPVDAA